MIDESEKICYTVGRGRIGIFGRHKREMTEHKAAKKAKKGILSVVFSRTALIVVLILLQLGVLVSLAQ